MNIFAVDQCPVIAAQSHFDLHVNKMVVEVGQLLSTAHRVLDGKKEIIIENKRKKTIYTHPTLDDVLYKATHVDHPSAVWIRQSSENYNWAYRYFGALCNEFTHRYNKSHLTKEKLLDVLRDAPNKIPVGSQTPFAIAFKKFPKCVVMFDKIKSYRNFYLTKQLTMKTVWTNRDIPEWWTSDKVVLDKLV